MKSPAIFFMMRITLALLIVVVHANIVHAGEIIRSNRNAALALNAWGGAAHGTVLRLHDGCDPTNLDCTWTYRQGMLISDRNPGLAINAWGGARHGAELRLHEGCLPDNPDCTWTYRDGRFVSNRDPTLAINAWGGAQHGTVVQLHNACEQDNPDCTWSFAEGQGEETRFVLGKREWDFGGGKHASSDGHFDRETGTLTLRTRTWTNSPFQGYTVGIKAFLVNSVGVVVWQSDSVTYGVDGTSTPFGSASDRIDIHNQQVDPALVSSITGMDIWIFHAPKWRLVAIINEIGEVAGNLAEAVQNFCDNIAELCHLARAVFAAPDALEPVLVVPDAPLPPTANSFQTVPISESQPSQGPGIESRPSETPMPAGDQTSQGPSIESRPPEPPMPAEFIFEALPPHLAPRVLEVEQARTPVPGQEAVLAVLKRLAPNDFPIRVCFFGGSPRLRADIVDAVLEWSRRTAAYGGRIDFDFGDLNAPRSCVNSEFNTIRIGFAYQGYWSLVGQDSYQLAAQYEQSMNFTRFDVAPPRREELRRIVMHEFGHALGMHHEHQNPFSVCEQEFNWDEIYKYMAGPPNYWKEERVDFNMRPLFNDVDATQFDPESIMLYTFPAEFYRDGQESECYEETNFELSEIDVRTMASFYPADSVVAAQQRDRALAEYTELLNAAPLLPEARLQALRAVEPLSGTELSPERKRGVAEEVLSATPLR